ncbi:hypothetical protein TNCV_3460901 [Trichonephila clavipes]|nr:hypothetical protein TNCV_3460901 [Trichonephila clavipes]
MQRSASRPVSHLPQTKSDSLSFFPTWCRVTLQRYVKMSATLQQLRRKTPDTLYRSVTNYPSFNAGY